MRGVARLAFELGRESARGGSHGNGPPPRPRPSPPRPRRSRTSRPRRAPRARRAVAAAPRSGGVARFADVAQARRPQAAPARGGPRRRAAGGRARARGSARTRACSARARGDRARTRPPLRPRREAPRRSSDRRRGEIAAAREALREAEAEDPIASVGPADARRPRDPPRSAVGGLRRDGARRGPRASPGRRPDDARRACACTRARTSRGRRSSSPPRRRRRHEQHPRARNLDTRVVRLGEVDALTIHEAAETTGWSPAHAALHRARRARRARALGLRLPPLRRRPSCSACAPCASCSPSTRSASADVGFALRLRSDDDLRAAVRRGSRPSPSVRRTSRSADWLRWEQEKHQQLLGGCRARCPDTQETA